MRYKTFNGPRPPIVPTPLVSLNFHLRHELVVDKRKLHTPIARDWANIIHSPESIPSAIHPAKNERPM